MDLTSSRNISSYMPRFNNSADSPQPCHLTVALLGLRRRYKPRQSRHFIIGAIPTLQEHAFPMAYMILCLRFTLVVRLIASSRWKVFSNLRLRATRKTRYEWLAKPYSTGTFTLLDAPSFACRTNASIKGALKARPAEGDFD